MIKLDNLSSYQSILDPQLASEALSKGLEVVLHAPGKSYHGAKVVSINAIHRLTQEETTETEDTPRRLVKELNATVYCKVENTQAMIDEELHDYLQTCAFEDVEPDEQVLQEIQKEISTIPLKAYKHGNYCFKIPIS